MSSWARVKVVLSRLCFLGAEFMFGDKVPTVEEKGEKREDDEEEDAK